MRPSRLYTYLGTVQGMCRQCRALVPARVLEEEGAVYQERLCPKCGSARARLADRVEWYLARAATTVACKASLLPGTPVKQGCPNDCGPCDVHANACHLPVFSVTNACNMSCPICFTYNRSDRKYFMSREELRALLDKLIARVGPLDLINITGGEPTLHPGILGLLEECKRPEIGRITMNSNGLRLASDEALCRALADLGIYVVLSFHTLQSEKSHRIHGRDVTGQKQKALEHLQQFGIGTTLLNVMIRGLNEGEIGGIIRLAKTHSVVRSVTVQTMTFTGQGGADFQPRENMPLDGAAAAIEQATNGEMRRGDFFPHTAAHPLCYSVAYYLKNGNTCRSLTDFFSVDELRGMLAQSYLLQPGDHGQEIFRRAIDRLWSEGDPGNILPAVRALLERMYPQGRALSPAERQAATEQSLLAIYLHSHMDEDTLDLARLAVCPDQVPDPDGRLIPACAYNLFYRQRDSRFWAPPLGAPASLPAGLQKRRDAGKDASAPSASAPSASAPSTAVDGFLTPSFIPANKETAKVMTQAPSPEPHLGWHSRGYVPHWDHPGMIQSLTFRLADAMPREVIDKWRMELGLPLAAPAPTRRAPNGRRNAGKDTGALSKVDPREIDLLKRIAKYEDEGHGACWLRDKRVAGAVERALLHFDRERYRLLAWCIMPNHVHVVIEAKEGFPLSEVLHSWKSYTSNEANRILGRRGRLWQREYRDRYIRNAEHFVNAVRYVEQNPVKAGLVKLASDWPFSSALFRSLGAPLPVMRTEAKYNRYPVAFREFLLGRTGERVFAAPSCHPSQPTGFCPCDGSFLARWRFYVKAWLLLTVLKLAWNGPKLKLLRWCGARVGRNVFISADVWIDPTFPQLLTIEDDVMIGVGAKIALHEFRPREFRAGHVVIRKGAVIGGFALIGHGVEIGEGAVVAGGAAVGRDVPAGKLAIGNPARVMPLGAPLGAPASSPASLKEARHAGKDAGAPSGAPSVGGPSHA